MNAAYVTKSPPSNAGSSVWSIKVDVMGWSKMPSSHAELSHRSGLVTWPTCRKILS